MKVFTSLTKEAGGMGGAILAKYAWWKIQHGGTLEEMTRGEVFDVRCVAEPGEDVAKIYNDFVELYRCCEEQLVNESS